MADHNNKNEHDRNTAGHSNTGQFTQGTDKMREPARPGSAQPASGTAHKDQTSAGQFPKDTGHGPKSGHGDQPR